MVEPQAKRWKKISHVLDVDSKFALAFEMLNQDRHASKLLVDFTVSVQGINFILHRSVIFVRCPYFQVLLSGQFKEQKETCLELKDVDVECFEKIVDYLYTGKLEVESDKVTVLVSLCDYFQLTLAKESLISHMVTNCSWISKENAPEAFFFANEANIHELKVTTSKFIIRNFDQYDGISLEIIQFAKKEGICRSAELVSMFPNWSLKKGKLECNQYLSLVDPAEVSSKAVNDLCNGLDQEQLLILCKASVASLHSNSFKLHISQNGDWKESDTSWKLTKGPARKFRYLVRNFNVGNLGKYSLIVYKSIEEELSEIVTLSLAKLIKKEEVGAAVAQGSLECDVFLTWDSPSTSVRKFFANSLFKFKKGATQKRPDCFLANYILFEKNLPFDSEVVISIQIWPK